LQAALAPVFARSALVVTREIEWGTVILGFEQANKYTIRDASGDVVAFLAEETNSIASAVGRQLLRRRRPVTATVLSPGGDIIFRVRRPMYLLNSTMHIEDAHGAVVGEVLQRWHLWRRHYDLYLHKAQFAQVRSGLLAWEFILEDEAGRPLAQIDRNFQGFGKELFTDAGMYVVHFGDALPGPEGLTTPPGWTAGGADGGAGQAAQQRRGADGGADGGAGRPAEQLQAQRLPPGAAPQVEGVVPAPDTWQPPALARPLALSERAAVLALAVAIDFDYFSQHSSGPGILPMGGMGMPIPIPMGGGSGEAAAAGEEAQGGGDGGDADAPSTPSAPQPDDWRDREQLGGDEAFKPDEEAPTWSDGAAEDEASDRDDDDHDGGGGGDEGGGSWGSFFGTIGSVLSGEDVDEE
jgi:uncharacterized protein YxjI